MFQGCQNADHYVNSSWHICFQQKWKSGTTQCTMPAAVIWNS